MPEDDWLPTPKTTVALPDTDTPDPDAAAIEMLRQIVANAKGEDLERAECGLESCSPRYRKGNLEHVEICRRHRAKWQAVHDMLERLIAGHKRNADLEAMRNWK